MYAIAYVFFVEVVLYTAKLIIIKIEYPTHVKVRQPPNFFIEGFSEVTLEINRFVARVFERFSHADKKRNVY